MDEKSKAANARKRLATRGTAGAGSGHGDASRSVGSVEDVLTLDRVDYAAVQWAVKTTLAVLDKLIETACDRNTRPAVLAERAELRRLKLRIDLLLSSVYGPDP